MAGFVLSTEGFRARFQLRHPPSPTVAFASEVGYGWQATLFVSIDLGAERQRRDDRVLEPKPAF